MAVRPEAHAFLQAVAGDVAATLEEIVGTEEAKGYLSLVGEQVGSRFDERYRAVHGDGPWSTGRVGEVLVDLKGSIGANFSVVAAEANEVRLVNDRCPFGEAAIGRPSLCTMTSNVFGRIAANHLGHVTVELSETIARGDGRCVARIRSNPELHLGSDNGRHYFAKDGG